MYIVYIISYLASNISSSLHVLYLKLTPGIVSLRNNNDVSPLCSRYLGAFCTSLQHTNVTSRWCMWRLRVACWVSGQEKAVRCALKHVVMTERHTKKPKPRAKVARYPYPRRMISYLIIRKYDISTLTSPLIRYCTYTKPLSIQDHSPTFLS